MTTKQACLPRLSQEGRLLNPVVHGKNASRELFRGELALKFATVTEREKRPPELKADQVLMASDLDSPTLAFFAGFLLSFEGLSTLAEVLGDMLTPEGKYFAFCGNIDLAERYQVSFGELSFYVLPLDESTVYNELLDLLNLEKNDLKKADSLGKIDAIARNVQKFTKKFERISYARGLEVMGPVKDPGEHRPV